MPKADKAPGHHVKTPWSGSTRRDRLPNNWPTIRARILKRDGCTCQLAYDCCTGIATDVDHVIPIDDHSDGNLHAVCRPCHNRKSASEGVAARRKVGSVSRPREQHPGMR